MARHELEHETVTCLTSEVDQMRRLCEALQEAVAEGKAVRPRTQGQIISLHPVSDREPLHLMRVFSKA